MKRSEVEQAILRAVHEHGVANVPWVVGVGKDAASMRIDSIVALLESEISGNDEKLVKSMRVCRDVLLGIYQNAERAEIACMLSCSCQRNGEHHHWPSYAAGCFDQGCESGNRLGGRVWDAAEFLRQHNDYTKPRLVAEVAVGALKTLANEFRDKEEGFLKVVAEVSSEQ